jgi:hypothetical protein
LIRQPAEIIVSQLFMSDGLAQQQSGFFVLQEEGGS